ncbi:ABC transporter substrate-binding protein [Halobacteria archaeon AArc-m2/3/4]|uniref:ABC transporter substrate-binding protein n=1 Tax=Natronoglomus mannanivorans TaxID=2979990 RepID=A0ABT2QGK2_9EURY|nr:ABC transporter substrate-binding protein [Halobacteria archaeon AArc-m2/3/4]
MGGDDDDGGDTDTGDDTSGSDDGVPERDGSDLPMIDQTYHIPHYDENPQETTLFSEEWWNTPSIDFLLTPVGGWKPMAAQEHIPHIFENVEVTDDEVTVTIFEDAEWSDGTDIVAEDLFRYFKIFDSLWQPIQPGDRALDEIRDPVSAIAPRPGEFWLDDAFVDNGKEAVFRGGDGHFLEKWTEEGVKEAFYGLPVLPPHDPDIYVEIVDRLEEYHREYDTPRETEEHEEWRNFTMDDDWDIGLDHITAGPFKIENVTDSQYILERHDGYPHADELNFTRIEASYLEDDEAHRAALVSDSLDWTDEVNIPQHALDSLPDHVEEFQHPDFGGMGLTVQGQHDVLGDPRVRQALMHMIDQEMATQLLAESMVDAEPIHTPGIQGGNDELVDDEFVDQLHTYDQDYERAEELLERAGFSEEGGDWYTPDGDLFQFEIHTDEDIPEFLLVIEDQFREFGLEVGVSTEEDAVFEDRFDNANFDMMEWGWEGEQEDVFIDFFWAIHSGIVRQQRGFWSHDEAEEIAADRDGLTYLESEAEEEGAYADIQGVVGGNLVDFTISAPPIGEFDGEPTEEYPVADHAIRFEYGYTFDDVDYTFEDALEECIWVYNWWLPEMPISMEFGHVFHNTRDWIVPDQSSAALWQGSYQFLSSGLVNADPDGRGDTID